MASIRGARRRRSVILDDDHAETARAGGRGAVRVEFLLDGADWRGTTTSSRRYDAIIDAVRAAGPSRSGSSHRTLGEEQDVWNDDRDRDGNNPYVEAFAETAKAAS